MNKELHQAAEQGDTETVRRLLDEGVNVNDVGRHHWPLLTQAAINGHVDLVRLLLVRGAERDKADKGDDKTALHWAAMRGCVEVVRVLLDHGAPVDAPDGYGLKTPLHLATSHAKTERAVATIRLLLERGANINARTQWETTPLFSAAFRGNTELLTFLLENGAELEARDNEGKTSLTLMSSFGFRSTETVRFLIEAGAAVDTQDNKGRTPLMWAASYGELEAVRALLDSGASHDVHDTQGRTALMHAAAPPAEQSFDAFVYKLAAEGKLKGQQGELYHARQEKRAALVRLLQERGADPNLRDTERCTAYDHALLSDNPRLLAELEAHNKT